MRSPQTSSSRQARSSHIFWEYRYVFIIILTIAFLFGVKHFSDTTHEGSGVIIGEITGSGTYVITDEKGTKRDGTSGASFLESDRTLAIISGNIHFANSTIVFWGDKNTQVEYETTGSGKGDFRLVEGRLWGETRKDTQIKTRHFSIDLNPSDTILVEQQSIFSKVYVLAGNPTIVTDDGKRLSLSSGKQIMVTGSSLKNPSITLESLSGPIDDSIRQNPFFIAHDGEKILAQEKERLSATGGISQSGSDTMLISASGGRNNTSISLTSPQDGAILKGESVDVVGIIHDTNVTRVSINEKNATIHSGSFSLQGLPFLTQNLDIIYKAYDAGGNILQKGVITVSSIDKKDGTEKLIPTTYPLSSKDFPIVSPKENPYTTKDRSITVMGKVPMNVVASITVNGYKLKKFTPGAASWYYFASMDYETMKEGFNLYELKFYGKDNTLLGSQLFTIIKEGKTLSGE